MGRDYKRYDIGRIVKNAEMLSNPQIYECFIYDCDDPEGFASVENEIEELSEHLPDGIGILDLPNTLIGNERTKVFGRANCAATSGHSIANMTSKKRVFEDEKEAMQAGFRPCAKCMPEEYEKWKNDKKYNDFVGNLYEGLVNGIYQ